MEKKENELIEIPYCTSCKNGFVIEENMNFLINSIKIYECKKDGDGNKLIGAPVDFNIINMQGQLLLRPFKEMGTFYLTAKRVVRATILEIKSEDYCTYTENNGDFTFVIQENK